MPDVPGAGDDREWTLGQARDLARDLLIASGVPVPAAARTAEALVLADAWGIGSHGLSRLPYYLERIAAGGCDPAAVLRVVTDTGPLACYDGGTGWATGRYGTPPSRPATGAGQAGWPWSPSAARRTAAPWASTRCRWCRREWSAWCSPTVPRSCPRGAAPPRWCRPARSRRGCGVPCRPRPAIVDLATSAVARGRIQAHAQRGEPIPAGWAFTAAGEATTDPVEAIAGMLAPLGGPKGFALAFLVEALTGGMVGPALSTGVSDMFTASGAAVPQRISHLVVALDPRRLDVAGNPAGTGGGQGRLDQLAAAVRAAGGRVPGAARPLPAEIADESELALSPKVRQDLTTWATRLNLP